jgi:hypothetical protein
MVALSRIKVAFQYVTFLPTLFLMERLCACYLTENMRLDFGREIAECEAGEGR